jgi:shikimate kinase
MMGSGKSAVAKILAERLEYALIDIDHEIEKRTGKSIEAIFNEEGQTRFRELETLIARDLKLKSPTIIATGGGFPLKAENRNWMKELGYVIWLRTSSVYILERIKDEDRPLLPKPITREHIENILKDRIPIYQQADIVIDTDDETLEALALKIIEDCNL